MLSNTLKIVKTYDNITSKNDYINHNISNEPKHGVLFKDFVHEISLRKSGRLSKSYYKHIRTLLKHLDNFSTINDAKLFTNSINEWFLNDFIKYLIELDLNQNYIRGIIQSIKSLARKAGTYGYAIDPSYDEVTVEKNNTQFTYLSLNEITRIYYYIGLTKKQEAIRDLFIVGCLTALRYSDYSNLSKDNFNNGFIYKLTQKTKVQVAIPLHDYVIEIYNKYNGTIPTKLSIQHFNRYLKLITHKIGIVDKITRSYIKGGKIITESKEKWELISSHTARRSAATNMYLTGTMSLPEIMAITGHTTEKSFFRYIGITRERLAKMVSNHNYFRK